MAHNNVNYPETIDEENEILGAESVGSPIFPTTASTSSVPISRKSTSSIWNFFEKIENFENIIKVIKAQHVLCGKKLAWSSKDGISHLKRHHDICHALDLLTRSGTCCF